MQDFTYKFFDIPNLEKIQDIIWDNIEDDWKKKQLYLPLDLKLVSKCKPLVEAINSFHDWNDVYELSLVIVLPKLEHEIHTDIGWPLPQNKYAFNIPIKNTEKTWTFFYKLKEGKNANFSMFEGVNMMHYQESDLIEIDKFVCNRPCFFNTQIPHKVQNCGNKVRALITVRCRTPFNFDKIFANSGV